MKNVITIVLILVLSSSMTILKAQENNIQFCDKIEIIDAELEKNLQVFKEYEGFQQARIFQKSEDQFILEIIYKPKDVFQIARKEISKAELETICNKIKEVTLTADVLLLDQSGRRRFLISSTASGIGFYAWALPAALDLNSFRGSVATYMLVGGSSFFVPFYATRSRKFTKPMARAYTVGTVTGIGHGFIGASILSARNNNLNNGRLFLPITLGLGEGLGLMALTNQQNLSMADLGMISTGAVWGTGWGASIGNLTVSSEDEFSSSVSKVAIPALIGSVGAAFAAHKVYQKVPDITSGDVLVMNSYGLLGSLVSATAFDLVVDNYELAESKALLTTMTAASIGGMAYGLFRTKDYNYSTSEGAYIGLSEIAGGLLGLGVGYLVNTDGLESEGALISTSLGATTGLLLVDGLLRNRDIKVETSIGAMDFGFNPLGVANAFNKEPLTMQEFQLGNGYIINAKIRF